MEPLSVLIVALITVVITGYVLYKLLSKPFKVLGFLFKAIVILVLGCLAWLGIFYWVIQ